MCLHNYKGEGCRIWTEDKGGKGSCTDMEERSLFVDTYQRTLVWLEGFSDESIVKGQPFIKNTEDLWMYLGRSKEWDRSLRVVSQSMIETLRRENEGRDFRN